MATQIPAKTPWSPTCVRWVSRLCEPARVPLHVMTDAGWAYVKDPWKSRGTGRSGLRVDRNGSWRRGWGFRTSTSRWWTIRDELRTALTKGCVTQPGPAFAARAVGGRSWDGTERRPRGDRKPRQWLGSSSLTCGRGIGIATRKTAEPCAATFAMSSSAKKGHAKGRNRLLAMDHTECFRTGHRLATRSLFGDRRRFETNAYGCSRRSGQGEREKQSRRPCQDWRSFESTNFRRGSQWYPGRLGSTRATRIALKSVLR